MPVDISFNADMTKVTAAIDRLIADARSNPVEIPLAPLSGGSRGGGGLTRPTVAGVLGQVQVPAWASALSGQGTGGGPPPTTSAGLAASRALRESSSGGWGRSSGGLGGLIGLSTAANVVARSFGDARQFNIDSLLAGGSQAAQTEAILNYRERLLSSGSFVGRGVGFLQDPTGMREAGVRATLDSAQSGDARTGAMADSAGFTAGLRDRAEISETTNPFQKRLREAESAHRKERQLIDETAKKQREADEKVIDDRKKTMAADLTARQDARFKRITHGPYRSAAEQNAARAASDEAQLNEDAAALAGTSSELAKQRDTRRKENLGFEDRRYNATVADDRREEEFRRRLSTGAAGFQAQEAVYSILGDAAGVRRTRQAAGTFQRLTQASRDRVGPGEFAAIFGASVVSTFAGMVDDQRATFTSGLHANAGAAVTQALLDRDPLGARLKQIEADRLAAMGAPGANVPAINAAAGLRSELVTRQDAEDRSFRDRALDSRGRQLELQLGNPLFGSISARSAQIADDAAAAAEKLAKDDSPHSGNAIAQILKNARTEQELLGQDFINRFRPQEVDVNRSDLSGGGDNGKVLDLLAQIAKNTASSQQAGPPRAQ
jgi:hypothetical protein